jgi:hypothetical protein
MKFNELTFETLADSEAAADQWSGIAKTAFDKKAFKFLANLTGRSAREAAHVTQAATAARVAREGELAVAAAKAGKPTEQLTKATAKLKGLETSYKGKGWGQRALERVKSPFGKGQHAAIRKQKATVSNLKAKKTTGPTGIAQSNLTAAQQAEQKAIEAARVAGEDVRGARLLGGTAIAGGALAASATGGGGRKRGPVIVA